MEPKPSVWGFPSLTGEAGARLTEDLVGLGADLRPGTVLAAYRQGIFPMGDPHHDAHEDASHPELNLSWWSPMQRGVLHPRAIRVSRSLARSRRRMEVRIDTAFDDVLSACADPSRPGAWITPAIAEAYTELHRLGWAHSVESWLDGELVGGLYGLAIGGLFAGESMFHHVSDASKVALVGLAEALDDEYVEARLIDTQWQTPHLASLGGTTMSRRAYLRRLTICAAVPLPAAFADVGRPLSRS